MQRGRDFTSWCTWRNHSFQTKEEVGFIVIAFFNTNLVSDRNMSKKNFIVWFSNIFALCLGNTFEEIIDLTYQASALSFLPMFFKKSQKHSKKLSIVAIKPVVGSDFNMPIRPRPWKPLALSRRALVRGCRHVTTGNLKIIMQSKS